MYWGHVLRWRRASRSVSVKTARTSGSWLCMRRCRCCPGALRHMPRPFSGLTAFPTPVCLLMSLHSFWSSSPPALATHFAVCTSPAPYFAFRLLPKPPLRVISHIWLFLFLLCVFAWFLLFVLFFGLAPAPRSVVLFSGLPC